MNMIPVKSSNLKSVGYDQTSKTLRVEFHNGASWDYSGIEPNEHAAMMHAPSIGSHFHAHIKSKKNAVSV